MSQLNQDSENALETATIELFEELGYEHAFLQSEVFAPEKPSPPPLPVGEELVSAKSSNYWGRETSRDVVFVPRLKSAIENLNPDLPQEAVSLAIEEIARDRSAMSPVKANQEVHDMLKQGVVVAWRNDDHEEVRERVRVIDWENPANNNFFLAQQMWITGELYKRRCDLVACVNGIPLVFIELKKPSVNVKHAYDDNLKDYQNNTIPQLWWYNAFIILSNGSESRLGSVSAQWEHFCEWKKVSSEGEQGVISLETMIRGTCEPSRLLDLIENFLVYMEARGGLAKVVAKNHQFLGVRNAVAKVKELRHAQETLTPIPSPSGRGAGGEGKTPNDLSRLGVFWHTQGSGKSLSMVFFCQYVMRKVPGNWTFVVVTDRKELDKQIYKTFANCGLINEKQCRAESGSDLQRLLTEDHQFVFTLIHKFQTQDGSAYPKLSDRDDVIVITDEAHRSQYDTLAMNMRRALPNAAFLGFTGTPLIAGEERTREVFGDYVSVYNFKQSIDDGATVPLYYENRIPELQLTNENLNEDMEALLEAAELDEEQEKKLERTFAREYHLITRDERLDTIAEDLVDHFMGRGVMGKAMVVSIDRFTAVRMYDKVRKAWAKKLKLAKIKVQRCDPGSDEETEALERVGYMKETDMAVIISGAQNEQAAFAEKGLTILPHRQRMVDEDLEKKFKDPDDELRIVFLCAMWLTGFDVPSCSTIYLDKPMKNHTLMQTIARANRVFPEKNNGLIVDYVGIFRNLQKALAIYGAGSGGGIGSGETPVENKKELVAMLGATIAETLEWCHKHDVDVKEIARLNGFERVNAIDEAVEKLLFPEEVKREFTSKTNLVVRLHKAVMPDPAAHEFDNIRSVLTVVRDKLRPEPGDVDIGHVMKAVEELLDESIATEGYVIRGGQSVAENHDPKFIDLGGIDFEALRDQFAKGRKQTVLEKLRRTIEKRLHAMVEKNRSRLDYLERFQKMIAEYNNGSKNIEQFFRQLQDFVKELNTEEKRGIREELSEEELVLFDILTKPEMDLSEKEKAEVKTVSRELLQKLKHEKLALDWRKKQQMRADVRLTIETMLDKLPRTFTPDLWQTKCNLVFQHVFDHYADARHSTYAMAG
jgi:type I restriction enzyme R subunit